MAEANPPVWKITRVARLHWIGLTACEDTGTKIWYPILLGSLADQLNNAQRVGEGLAVIARALASAEDTGEGYAIAELHRIKGELLLNSSDLLHAGKFPGHPSTISTLFEARASFADALRIAKRQGARSWELKAALSTLRLETQWREPDQTQLAEICSTFTEGLETVDLKQARALLDAAPSRGQWLRCQEARSDLPPKMLSHSTDQCRRAASPFSAHFYSVLLGHQSFADYVGGGDERPRPMLKDPR